MGRLYLSGRGAEATAVYHDNGMTVLAGSCLAPDCTPSFTAPEKRMKQLDELTEINKEGKRVLKLNKQFDSPSAASNFCLGRSSNGWEEWKNKKGVSLKALLQSNL